MSKKVRTRFAPSPTGRMHVGNLRTALYAYLIAKHEGGDFILRVEDTDQERFVEGALDIIYRTLAKTGLVHDEGPDKDAGYGPYVQSERNAAGLYLKYAKQLVEQGDAYYCFCDKERLESLKTTVSESGTEISVYDKHCLSLSKEEVEANLAAGKPWVIRLNVPNEGTTTFHDEIYGDITVPNAELDDMILIKSDGYPTYNFANVIDDHLMEITHVVRPLKTTSVIVSASPGTVELWADHTPSARVSCWPSWVRACCRSSPGMTFCTRLTSRSCPPSIRWRNWSLYQSTVSPERRTTGWERGSRLNFVFDFVKSPPQTQRASWLRRR